ncbi:MAG: signal recognition particle-docking protein FtsY [Acidimicrobiales bacterium]|jgi:fused signal recognition particle receptor
MTLVIVLIVVAVLLVASGALVIGTRSRRRLGRLAQARPPQPRAPQPHPVPAAAPEAGPPAAAEAPAVRPVLRDRLGRARGLLAGYFDQVRGRTGIDEATFEELEEALILADVGVPTTTRVLADLRDRLRTGALPAADPTVLLQALQADLTSMFEGDVASLAYADGEGPTVWLFVGVNGVGKTTTIGKLALRETQAGRSVVLAAGDTFRAAAGEQLESWAERAGARIVRGSDGADPSSVIFDAVQHAASRGAGLVLADTAGRLHTKVNLMDELRKVRRVADRPPGQLTEVLLVLDATTGQNGVAQARQFTEAVGVTGIVLTKLDGTAKGGVVLAIRSELGLPIKLVGVGEGPADLVAFDPAEFVSALFG